MSEGLWGGIYDLDLHLSWALAVVLSLKKRDGGGVMAMGMLNRVRDLGG